MTRVYLPATLATLADAYVAGRFEAGRVAHAVTPAVREWYIEGDVEELEYAALTDAAAASLRLLAAEAAIPVDSSGPSGSGSGTGSGPGARYAHRRVVISADVDPGAVAARHDELFRSAIRLSADVPLSAVVSVHVDDEVDVVARAAVAGALDALPAADAGDDDARFALDEAESHELLWYDVTEIPDLI